VAPLLGDGPLMQPIDALPAMPLDVPAQIVFDHHAWRS